ncbi:MAG: histidinol-phosphatase [Bacilli bacterium]
MLTDWHNHLEKGTLSLDYMMEFVNEAKKKGIEHFGMSEHAYHFYETADILQNEWVNPRRFWHMKEYEILFRQAWEKGVDIRYSIEMDYTPGKHAEMEKFIKSYDFDYVIGSVHWVGDFGIDLAEYRHEWDKRDLYEVYRGYYDQIITLAESDLFDIVGHIDLVKIFKYVPDNKEFLLEQYDRVTDALKNSKTCVEISTAGLRKPVGELYPDKDLLQMCKNKGVRIVLSSDAHEPEHVGYEYDKAIALAKSVGYDSIVTFQRGEHKNIPLG